MGLELDGIRMYMYLISTSVQLLCYLWCSPRNSDAVKDKENAKDKEKKKETSRVSCSDCAHARHGIAVPSADTVITV